MGRLIVCTFLFLGWGFYELSGGSDFQAPQPVQTTQLDLAPLATTDVEVTQASAEIVTRARATPAVAEILTPRPTPAFLSVTDVPDEAEVAAAAALQAEEEAAAVEIAAVVKPVIDLRAVTGNRVNMRNGPGTNFQVVAKLVRGDQAEVLQSSGDGWVKIRTMDTGRIGWMAERLMAKVEAQ